MKKAVILSVMLLSFTATGCTGSFNLTRKVYNFHRSQDDKWADEIGFLVCALLPIYGISTLADALVFNSIEFWTGENPVTVSGVDSATKQVKQDGTEATISYNADSRQLTIASDKAPTYTFERTGDMVVAKDQAGNIAYATSMNAKGEVVVYDSDLQLVKAYSPSEVNQLKAKYTK